MSKLNWYLIKLLFTHSVLSDSLRPRRYSTPGSPVLQYLLEFALTHIHGVDDAIQPSHSLSPLSPPEFDSDSDLIFVNMLPKTCVGLCVSVLLIQL